MLTIDMVLPQYRITVDMLNHHKSGTPLRAFLFEPPNFIAYTLYYTGIFDSWSVDGGSGRLLTRTDYVITSMVTNIDDKLLFLAKMTGDFSCLCRKNI